MAITDRLSDTLGLIITMHKARLIAPLRPDKYLRIPAAMQRENMSITSGFASPEHADVAEGAVFGVDDEQFGQRLAAFVVLKPSALATPDSLRQHVRNSLANYKVPREITILPELLRNNTGKIARRDLQALADRG